MSAILGLGAAAFPSAAPAGPAQVDPALTRDSGPLQAIRSPRREKGGTS